MHDTVKAHFNKLEKALRSTTIPEDRREVVSDSIRKLTDLYAQSAQSNESRFTDRIAVLVEVVLRELQTCPKAQNLDADFRNGLRLLHEELGIPALTLKPAPAPKKLKKIAK